MFYVEFILHRYKFQRGWDNRSWMWKSLLTIMVIIKLWATSHLTLTKKNCTKWKPICWLTLRHWAATETMGYWSRIKVASDQNGAYVSINLQYYTHPITKY